MAKILTTLTLLLTLGVGQMWADNYYVRGASPFSWDDGTLMDHSSVSDNVYYLEVYGSREFKVVNAYQGWSCSVNKGSGDVKEAPSDNVTLGGSGNITGGGNYTWYICYDTSDGKVYGTTANPDTPSYPDMCIAGNSWGGLGNWSANGSSMTNNGDGTYEWTSSSVTAGTNCQFKLCPNCNWDSSIGYSNKVSGTNCSSGPSGESGDGSNIQFTPSVAGSVTVTYNSNTDKIVISCPTPQWQLRSTGSGSPHGTFAGSGDGPYTLDVTYNSSTMNWGAARFDLNGTSYICNNYTIGTSGKLALRAENAYTAISGITNGASYTFTITYESGTWYVQIAANCTAPTIAWNTTPSNGTAGGSMTASVTTNQTSPTITWNSSNTDVATVSSGVINYVAAGSTCITASYTGNGSTHCATTVSVYQDITVESNNYTWKLKQNDTELGTFSSDGNNTYHLDFEVTAGYNSNLHFVSTEASIDHAPSSETHLGSANKRTMVNDGGRNSWNDGIGKYRFYIQKISSTWYLYAERLYSVSYNGNSQSSGTAPSTTYHLAGSNVTVASNSGSLAKTGYDFGGWNENSSGTGTNYAAGSGVISSISADKNLFAKWTAQNYTITYKDKGGEAFSGVHGSGYPTSHTYGSVTNLVSPTKANYIFGGWCETSDCNGDVVTSIGATAKTAAFTLYAKWVPAAPSAALLAGNFPELNNWGNCGTMTKSTSGSVTTFTYTLYDVPAGTYEFCLKPSGGCGGSAAILKPAQNYVVTQTQTGCTSFGESGDSNHNFKVVTGSAGDITVTVTYNSSTPSVNVDVTRVDIATSSSGWYMIGDTPPFKGWGGTNTECPINRSYRGMSNVYYRVANFPDEDKHFKLSDGTTEKGTSNTSSDTEIEKKTQYAIVTNTSKAFKNTDGGLVFCVFDKTNTKFWIQDPQTYYSVNVTNEGSGSKGTYKVTLNSSSVAPSGLVGKEMTKFANGETFKITVTGVTGYIPTITIGSTPTTFNKEATTYEATGTMGTGDVAVSITYTASYTVNYEVGTVKGNKNDIKLYVGSVAVGNLISSGTKVKSGTEVFFWVNNNTTQSEFCKPGYNWWGFRDAPAGTDPTHYTNADVTVYHPTISANTTVYAVFGETDYTVTVNAGEGGDVASTSVTGHIATKVTLPTAVADPGYYFTGWTRVSGSTVTWTNQSSATAAQVNGLTSGVTVQANFAPLWTLKGGKTGQSDWSLDAHIFTSYVVNDQSHNEGQQSFTLDPNTTYRIKLRNRQTSSDYGLASGAATTNVYYATSNNWWVMTNASGNQNLIVNTAAGGTYNFYWDIDDNELFVLYPTSWYITTGQSDAAGGSYTAVDNSSNNVKGGKFVANNATVTCTASPNTGYTFGGWYSDASCETAYVNGTGGATISGEGGVVLTLSSITANKTIYAKFEPKTYTVTLTQTGAASTGTAEVTATYNATAPSIASLPTAPQGYGFMGYYTATGGGGSQIVAANGTWQNVDGYTSGGKWVRDADTELFAYFKKAKITALTCDATIVTPNTTMGVTPTISPTPAGTTSICWRVLHGNGNPLAEQPTFSANPTTGSTKVTFPASSASGTYLIEAVLRTGSVCGAGTVLDSVTASFQVAGKHIVTIQYKSGDYTLKSSTGVDAQPLAWSDDIAAPDITGYTFASWEAGDGVTIKDAAGEDKTTSTYSTIKIKANYDSKLTALYTKKNMIYFYNTLGWDTVFVYFYENGNYWSDTYGTGANQYQNWGGQNPYWFGEHGGMKRVAPGSDIWYFDYTAAGYETRANVVFADKDQSKQVECAGDNACIFFSDNAKVARRSDHNSSLPMFVPLSNQTGVNKNENRAKYYSDGYWMNYPENTGYTLKLYSSQDATTPTRTIRFPFSADTKMPLKLDVELNEAATNYYYTIYREDGTVLSASYGMNKNHHTNVRLNSPSTKISIKTTAPGIYKYSLVYMNNSGTKDYYISVDYPIVENDYRVLYSDNAQWSQSTAHGAGWSHPSDVVRKNTDAEVTQYDTVSFYISKGAGITASMKFQYAKTIVEAGTITWQDVTGGGINAADTISKAGVYNFIIKQEGTAKPVVEKVEPYTGNYYIRTDGAGSTKWDYYRTSDHEMTYTEFSMSAANSFGDKYSHYFMHWSPGGTNIKFCVANDYSPSISDTLEYDLHNWNNLNAGGELKHEAGKSALEDRYSANVRFMYNQETNKISRAYVASSTNAARKFLVLRGNEVIKDENGTAVNDQGVTNGAILSDKENWIYERILYIKPDSRFKLFACYAEATPSESGAQYFRGAYESGAWAADNTKSVILISGTGDHQKARILYDFKTNRLICAWLPSDATITEELNIDADVMVIRDHQEAAECITFSGDGELKKVKTVYGAMKFNRWTLNNRYRGIGGVEDNAKDHCDTDEHIAYYHGVLPAGDQKSVYERSLYFISFPFDVKVSEIFGFGTYGKHWVLEYYDGLNRAKNGYWIDSPANWKYVTPSMAKTYELKAYEGYILCLSLGRMAYDNIEVWPNNISNVELYFPSKTEMKDIQTTDVTIPGLSDEYRCTINRGTPDGDRRIKDSYWRCLGVPSYDMYAGTLTSDGSHVINWRTTYDNFPFIYAWNMDDNTLTAQSTNRFTFKPMHAYLAQIGTAIYWTNVSATPAVMARQTEEPTEYSWRLTLNAGEQMIDQTYIRMSTDEHITNEFDFGQDLAKELNAGRSDIYSFIGYERAAANSLQMNTETTTIVPLGLNIETTGEYTFSIPDGTNGIGITLIDEETGIRTSLSALDYTIELAAGDYTERFWLEISPVKGAETGIDPGVDARENSIRKVMIDGILYIIRDGKMYDARGARVE